MELFTATKHHSLYFAAVDNKTGIVIVKHFQTRSNGLACAFLEGCRCSE